MQIPPLLPRAPFLALTAAMCGGILLVYACGCGWAWAIGPGVAAIIFWSVWPALSRRLGYGWRNLSYLAIALGFAALGVATALMHKPIDADSLPQGWIATGTVEQSRLTSGGTRVVAKMERLAPRYGGQTPIRLNTRALIYLSDSLSLSPGEGISALATFEKPTATGGYADYLFSEGIDLQASVDSGFYSRRPSRTAPGTAAMRAEVADKLQKSALTPDAAVFITALLTGDMPREGREMREQFARAGIAHVLAVSGMHVGIVVGLVTLLFLPLDLVRGRRFRFALTIMAVWVFALFTGMRAPVVRAAVMTTFLLAGLMLERPGTALNSLMAAAFFILLFDPRALFHTGFLLSFAVTLGIVTVPGIVLPKRRPITAWRRVGLWLLVPVVAFLVSWLLTARFFHSVPLLFLPANLLIVPLLPVYFSAGAVYVCSLLCGWDPTWLAWLLNTAFSLLSASAGAVADAGATVSQVWPRTLTVALYMSAIGGFILWLLTRTRLWWYAACALMLSSIAVPFILRPQLPADALSCVPSGGGVRITATHLEQRAVLELPSDSLSAGMLRGRRFVFADTPIAATPAGAKPLKIKWLIIGPGYEGSLARLVGAFAPDSVIFHPWMELDRIQALLSEAGLEASARNCAGVSGVCLPRNR